MRPGPRGLWKDGTLLSRLVESFVGTDLAPGVHALPLYRLDLLGFSVPPKVNTVSYFIPPTADERALRVSPWGGVLFCSTRVAGRGHGWAAQRLLGVGGCQPRGQEQ